MLLITLLMTVFCHLYVMMYHLKLSSINKTKKYNLVTMSICPENLVLYSRV